MTLKGQPGLLSETVEEALQLACDCEAQATRLRFDPTALCLREDLRPMLSPVLLMFEAARMLLASVGLLIAAAPSDRDAYARVEGQVTEALGRVIALDTLWQTMGGES
jgi:hypothetical protein